MDAYFPKQLNWIPNKPQKEEQIYVVGIFRASSEMSIWFEKNSEGW